MASGQGQGRLTESRKALSSTDAIAAITSFYGKAASHRKDSPTRKKCPKKRKVQGSSSGADANDAIDLSDTESIGGSGEALATVLGLPPRVM